MAETRKLQEDELVASLIPDPSQPAQETYTITGWVGRSSQKGFWRLYVSPELDEFIEIAESDIVMSQPVGSVSPLGGTALVIKGKAELRGVSGDHVDARTAFLLGDITASATDASSADALAPAVGVVYNKNYTKGFWCNVSMFFSCATHVVRNRICTTASGKLCGTARFLP